MKKVTLVSALVGVSLAQSNIDITPLLTAWAFPDCTKSPLKDNGICDTTASK